MWRWRNEASDTGDGRGQAYLDLQNRARRERRGTQELLTLYVVERWLARLSASPFRDDFVLKGGVLLAAYGARRSTADADALARNLANDEASVVAHVVEIAQQPVPDDDVEFRVDTITSRVIRDEALYAGVRLAMDCAIASAVVKLRLDVNFGDPVTPPPRLVELPALRPDQPPVRLLGYPIETVLAEKIATAIALGPANTRVRDYADIYVLTGAVDLRREPLTMQGVRAALVSTAQYRAVELSRLSDAIGDLIEGRARTYAAYRAGLGPDGDRLPSGFGDVVAAVLAFADGLIDEGGVDEELTDAAWDHVARRWIV